jgi:hypothetical protein
MNGFRKMREMTFRRVSFFASKHSTSERIISCIECRPLDHQIIQVDGDALGHSIPNVPGASIILAAAVQGGGFFVSGQFLVFSVPNLMI